MFIKGPDGQQMIDADNPEARQQLYNAAMDKIAIRRYHQQYLNWQIDEYELADLLGVEYTEIGTYIMSNNLRRIK